MKNKIKKQINKKTIIIIILVLIILVATIGSFAKYIMSTKGVINASVDKVYYTIVKDQESVTEGNVASFYFNVNNYDGDLINQVLMKYYLKISNLDSTAVSSYKVYFKDTSNVWNELSKITTGEYTNYFQSTANLEFGSKKTYNYKLELTLNDQIPIIAEYDFDVDIKLVQTK